MDYTGRKAALCTIGCKLNFSETSAIACSLEDIGFQKVNFDEKADVYIINTCSVTKAGDKSSRNMVRKALRKNPGALIVVTGCYAQLKPVEISHISGVDMILGTREKFLLATLLDDLTKKEIPEIHISGLQEMQEYHGFFSQSDRTRNFLKIQDGCDYFCTFCVVPYARGRSRNETIGNVIGDARRAVAQGFKEIVLTGVNIGDFGKSTGETFYDLLVAIEKVEGLQRLRMGSVEPNLLTDEIIGLVAASKVIMPHFHIPLQSGSDEILGLMKRRYTTELFASRIARIRGLLPHAFIGVDVIAGTNGETDAHFRESYNFINRLEISQLHAFPYSERSGTQALKIPLKVPLEERKSRTLKYIHLSQKKLRSFYEMNKGSIQSVLFEERVMDDRMTGFTGNYIRTECKYQPQYINETVNVRLGSILPDGNMLAELQD